MSRYFSMICGSTTSDEVRRFQTLTAVVRSRSSAWAVAYQGPRQLVLSRAPQVSASEIYNLGVAGVIVGKLFPRQDLSSSYRGAVRLNEATAQRIVESGGAYLVANYWGSYIALLHDQQAGLHHVFRDPTGNTPCYHARYECADVFFSNLEDYVRLLRAPIAMDRGYFIRWLIAGAISSRTTGIEGVEDLPSGERLSIQQSQLTRTRIWSPEAFARNPVIGETKSAARRLRASVQASVDAWASCYDSVGVRLSGGLDSSIVALCLRQSPSRTATSGINFWIDAPYGQSRRAVEGATAHELDKFDSITSGGDERYFARSVAKQCGITLIERRRDASIDLRRMWDAPILPAPALYYTMIEVDDAEIELAKCAGVQAYFTGQAGDSVLHIATQPFAAIDFAYLHGIRPALWTHLFNAARLSRESLWSVMRKTLKQGVLRRPSGPPVDFLSFPTLVPSELLRTLTARDFESPWTPLCAGLPPGKQDHLSGLAGSMYYNYIFFSAAHADHIDPLNSQLVWETMLEAPTYTVLANGMSRGLARVAFADLLPAEIRRRQVKGGGGAFYQTVVDRNKNFLYDVLMNGRMVKERYLDREKLEAYFKAENCHMIVGASQLLSYAAAEVWMEQLTLIPQQSALHEPNFLSKPHHA